MLRNVDKRFHSFLTLNFFVCPGKLWKYHFLMAIFFAILDNEKIGSLAALLLLFFVLLWICSIRYKLQLQPTHFST